MPQCTAMCAAAISVCVVIITNMTTYSALVHTTAHSRPTKRCCCVGKMQGHVTQPSKFMLNTAPRDAASATALLDTVCLRTKYFDKHEVTTVMHNHTHADERYALQFRRWCATTMVMRWTARSHTLQWCHQSLNQVVPTYTHTVHYTLHSIMHQHSPPHHHTLLL